MSYAYVHCTMTYIMKNSKKGFALPTVLISSVVLLSILVTAVSATVAVRTGLQAQKWSQMAQLAGEAGTAYGVACLENSNYTVTWTAQKPLKPDTDCNGDTVPGASAYVADVSNFRTYFVVNPPSMTGSMVGEGFVEVLRTSTGTAWRVWGSSVATAIGGNVATTPAGTSIEGYWTSPPVGYLLENGQSVSRTEYASLFAVIGTTFGAGNGSTTFNVPDSRGRVAVNLNPADSEFNTIGKTSGAKTHTLTIAQMPSHTHIQNAHNHTQNPHNHANPVAVTNGGNAGNFRSIFATNSPFWSRADWNNATASTTATNNAATATNQSTGGSGAHNNIQPSIVVTRAIKF